MDTIRVKSYWNWLPPEIQEYIVLLAQYQHAVAVQVDIVNYNKLKVKWGLGPIVLKHNNCRNIKLCHCNGRIPGTNKHLTIYGKYEGLFHDVKQRFLGHSFKEALERANDPKLFLFTAYNKYNKYRYNKNCVYSMRVFFIF